jgi:hypothetical protein
LDADHPAYVTEAAAKTMPTTICTVLRAPTSAVRSATERGGAANLVWKTLLHVRLGSLLRELYVRR